MFILLTLLLVDGKKMFEETYAKQKDNTPESTWRQAKRQAENENQQNTAEDAMHTILSDIKDSKIEILESDGTPQCGKYHNTVWVETVMPSCNVRSELFDILQKMDLTLNCVRKRSKLDGSKRFTVEIPFIREETKQRKTRKDTVRFAKDMRDYWIINEDDITRDCPRDDCDGKEYRDGMGSYGPQYKCTRKACTYEFEKHL